jgi:hypothetical protein
VSGSWFTAGMALGLGHCFPLPLGPGMQLCPALPQQAVDASLQGLDQARTTTWLDDFLHVGSPGRGFWSHGAGSSAQATFLNLHAQVLEQSMIS